MHHRCSATRRRMIITNPDTKKTLLRALSPALTCGNICRGSIRSFSESEQNEQNYPENSHKVPIPSDDARDRCPAFDLHWVVCRRPGPEQHRSECGDAAYHMHGMYSGKDVEE